MLKETNLRIEIENGRFYVYDKLECGNSICYGAFNTEKEAQERLDECLAIEMSTNKENARRAA